MVEKIGKRISSLLILFTIGASYTIWLLGIYHPLIALGLAIVHITLAELLWSF